jgi:hypothetical protein
LGTYYEVFGWWQRTDLDLDHGTTEDSRKGNMREEERWGMGNQVQQKYTLSIGLMAVNKGCNGGDN